MCVMHRCCGELPAHALSWGRGTYACWIMLNKEAQRGRREVKQCLFWLHQVLASDGVWEVMSCAEVAHFVARWRKRPWVGWSAADALTLEAQERWKQLQPEVRLLVLPVLLVQLEWCPEPFR